MPQGESSSSVRGGIVCRTRAQRARTRQECVARRMQRQQPLRSCPHLLQRIRVNDVPLGSEGAVLLCAPLRAQRRRCLRLLYLLVVSSRIDLEQRIRNGRVCKPQPAEATTSTSAEPTNGNIETARRTIFPRLLLLLFQLELGKPLLLLPGVLRPSGSSTHSTVRSHPALTHASYNVARQRRRSSPRGRGPWRTTWQSAEECRHQRSATRSAALRPHGRWRQKRTSGRCQSDDHAARRCGAGSY